MDFWLTKFYMIPRNLFNELGIGLHDWCLEVWGDYACFTRPEMKVERVSYDVMTPSAARAIFESILWKPAMKWNVTKIEVLNPIKWVSVRRNEVGKKIPTPTARQMNGEVSLPSGMFVEDERQQRAGLFLKDVKYRIHGYFDFIPLEMREKSSTTIDLFREETEKSSEIRNDETEEKYAAIFQRRARKGQCFTRPYLGSREFSCYFKLVDPNAEPSVPIDETRELGFMLYDMDFDRDANNPPPLFFNAKIDKGVVMTDRKKVELRG